MLNLLGRVPSTSRWSRSTRYWHSPWTDPQSTDLLYYHDDYVAILQRKLRDLKQNKTSYASSILYFMYKICIIDIEILIPHIRAVLEIFILYSIETSDLKWISDSRAIHLSRSIETLSNVDCRDPRLSPLLHQFNQPPSMRICLRISDHMKSHSRFDQCRAEIIQALVDWSEMMRLDDSLSTYNLTIPRHQQNSPNFREVETCRLLLDLDGILFGYGVRMRV